MNDKELALFVGHKIKEFRLAKGLTQKELAARIGMGDTTIVNYEKGARTPKKNTIFKIAEVLGTSIDDFFPPIISSKKIDNDSVIAQQMEKLTPDNQEKVLEYIKKLLEEQERENRPKIIIEEPVIEYKTYYRSAAKAGPTGFGYDDYADENSDFVYVSEEPPRYDLATLVDGNSMNPDYHDGDVLYLRDYGTTTYDGDLCVVIINDKSYFKKVYTTDTGLRLVSTNPDKERYPDKYVDFPPSDGTHIKIFDVVGSATPIEK